MDKKEVATHESSTDTQNNAVVLAGATHHENTKPLTKDDIDMREPKVRDFVAVGHIETNEEKEVTMIASLTQTPVEDLLDMSMKEFAPYQEKLQSFLA